MFTIPEIRRGFVQNVRRKIKRNLMLVKDRSWIVLHWRLHPFVVFCCFTDSNNDERWSSNRWSVGMITRFELVYFGEYVSNAAHALPTYTNWINKVPYIENLFTKATAIRNNEQFDVYVFEGGAEFLFSFLFRARFCSVEMIYEQLSQRAIQLQRWTPIFFQYHNIFLHILFDIRILCSFDRSIAVAVTPIVWSMYGIFECLRAKFPHNMEELKAQHLTTFSKNSTWDFLSSGMKWVW